MSGQGQGDYSVDIVMCIDKTGSMKPIIDEVKANALSLHQRFVEAMEEADKGVDQVRIKVIAFGDIKDDPVPFLESDFFTLPDQNEAFQSFVNGIVADGGGDIPENALEAIAKAIKSDWTTVGSKKRQAVIVFSDAPALPLEARKDCPNYPQGMPANLAELGAWWEGTDQTVGGNYQRKAGRLIAFVPNAEPWTEISTWNRYWPAYSKAGEGLSELDMQAVIDLLVGSVD